MMKRMEDVSDGPAQTKPSKRCLALESNICCGVLETILNRLKKGVFEDCFLTHFLI